MSDDFLDDLPDLTDEERLADWEHEIASDKEGTNVGEQFIAVVRLCRKLMNQRNTLLVDLRNLRN